jgi:hypothetical protein
MKKSNKTIKVSHSFSDTENAVDLYNIELGDKYLEMWVDTDNNSQFPIFDFCDYDNLASFYFELNDLKNKSEYIQEIEEAVKSISTIVGHRKYQLTAFENS